jgi:hypothetical protein
MTSTASFPCNYTPAQGQIFLPPYIESATTDGRVEEVALNEMSLRYDGTGAFVHSNDCNRPGWISSNPLTLNANTGQRMVFDRPVYTGKMAGINACNSGLYGDAFARVRPQVYKTYFDIQGGDEQFYVDKSNIFPYRNPVYASAAKVDSRVFVTPNEVVWPRYERSALDACSGRSDCFGGVAQNGGAGYKCSIPTTLSALSDSQQHREDIIARQSGRINRQDWAYRYGPATVGM